MHAHRLGKRGGPGQPRRVPPHDRSTLLSAQPAGQYIEASNPRNAYEENTGREISRLDGKVILTDRLDNPTHFVEHPEAIAERTVLYAEVVGRESVVAGLQKVRVSVARSLQGS